uniref:Gustatory receptor n=1 Tax=Parastrongyloides trichosuri TaxID=131310 RepID=A0A0N4Z5K2_PARTI
MENGEDVESFNSSPYSEENLKNFVFFPLYPLFRVIGIPRCILMEEKPRKRDVYFNIVRLTILLLPFIALFVISIIIGSKYVYLSLRQQENSIYSCFYIHAFLAILSYMNLRKSGFFYKFINSLKEYKEIQLVQTPLVERSNNKLRIKIYIFWGLFLTTIIYTCIVNFLLYPKNVEEDKKYKLSKFYNQSTYFLDSIILLYTVITILLFITIFHCIYGVLDYETEVFNEESKYVLDNNTDNIQETIELLSKKHIKLFSMLTHGVQGLEKYTDLAIFNTTMVIIFAISVYRYYNGINNTVEAIEYMLIILSCIYLEVLLLLPIVWIDKNVHNVKNTILNNSLIWESKNENVQMLASTMVTRIEACEYHGKMIGLVTFNERTISFLLVVVIILSAMLKAAVF